NRPTLPPLANGHIRSITLMPVSSNSFAAACSSYEGAARWITHWSCASTGPRSSIGSPSTFMMRPSVALPTGTLIAAPVLSTASPRFRPSVEPSAMVRTTPSPSCCCTSSVTAVPCTLSASYTFGTDSRGNSTSTTAPMICTTLPWFIAMSSQIACLVGACLQAMLARRRSPTNNSSNRRGAADDFRDFLRDRRLPCLVVDQRQRVDRLGRVVGCRLHGHHARGVLAGQVFQHRVVHQRLDVAFQHVIDDRFGFRLVDVVPVVLAMHHRGLRAGRLRVGR